MMRINEQFSYLMHEKEYHAKWMAWRESEMVHSLRAYVTNQNSHFCERK